MRVAVLASRAAGETIGDGRMLDAADALHLATRGGAPVLRAAVASGDAAPAIPPTKK